MVVVAMSMPQTINLGSVFTHSSLHDSRLFKLLQAAVCGGRITSVIRKRGMGFLG
jgi:hypothetical protein